MVDIGDKSHISFQVTIDDSDMLVEKRILISPKKMSLISNQGDGEHSAESLERKLAYACKICQGTDLASISILALFKFDLTIIVNRLNYSSHTGCLLINSEALHKVPFA